MRLSSSIIASVACAGLMALAAVPARAGTFDCSVIYDEFESLMNREFLVSPDRFVQTVPGRISREQFAGVADAGFRLYPSRDGMGIGIITTNLNIHAKFLFHWSQPLEDGSVHVILEEVVKYGRVDDGYAPSRMGPFRLKPGMALDLDSGDYIQAKDSLLSEEEKAKELEAGDLQYESGPDGSYLTSINGAQVQFPLETMCR